MSDDSKRTGLFGELFPVVFAFGQSRGLKLEDMARVSGLTPIEVMDPNKRHSDEAMMPLWQMLRETDTDGTIPIKFAAGAPMSVYGGLAEGARFADTLGTALEHFARNKVMIGDRVMFEIDAGPNSALLSIHHPLDYKDNGYISATGLCLIMRLIADVLGFKGAAVNARLRLPDGCGQEAFETFFGCPVQLGQSVNEITLDRAAYDGSINHANAELFAYVDAYFAERRKSLEPPDRNNRLHRLRDAAIEQAMQSNYKPAAVARAANLSLRGAQRLALQQGYSLQGLIDEVRFENARAMLTNTDLSVHEIAIALSYSDDRSFRRAFKRVIGQSPSAFRKSVVSGN